MSNQPFQFKQFTINQDKCAMKVGTDAVLLGAWASIEHYPFSILDIGAGTGIISLMLSQRSNAEIIDAIEIEENAYEQCVGNFESSPWNDRLFCYHASLEEFANEIEDTYDLIVSNPPFYGEDYKTNSVQRDLARFNDALPFNELIVYSSKLLSEQGKLTIIVPFSRELELIYLAKKSNLYANRILQVKGNPNSEFKRSIIEFSFHETEVKVSELIIENERHNYTKEYIALTKDFYLKM